MTFYNNQWEKFTKSKFEITNSYPWSDPWSDPQSDPWSDPKSDPKARNFKQNCGLAATEIDSI